MATQIDANFSTKKDLLVDIENACLRVSNRTLIQDFTFQIVRGKRIGLTGPSGCGKTTLLRSIASRRLPANSTANRFYIKSDPIGYVSQLGGMLPWFSVRRNLQIFSLSNTKPALERCERILSQFELVQSGDTFPEQLSGGERQRARLACAMAAQPVLYCADEPLTEVGLEQKWRLLNEWSSEMKNSQTSLIIVSHDIDTLIYLCDEIILLGSTGEEPAKILTRYDIPDLPHPRSLTDINNTDLTTIRQKIFDSLLKPSRTHSR